jgi:hypothetical protein
MVMRFLNSGAASVANSDGVVSRSSDAESAHLPQSGREVLGKALDAVAGRLDKNRGALVREVFGLIPGTPRPPQLQLKVREILSAYPPIQDAVDAALRELAYGKKKAPPEEVPSGAKLR